MRMSIKPYSRPAHSKFHFMLKVPTSKDWNFWNNEGDMSALRPRSAATLLMSTKQVDLPRSPAAQDGQLSRTFAVALFPVLASVILMLSMPIHGQLRIVIDKAAQITLLQFSSPDMVPVAKATTKSESESVSPQLPSPGLYQVAWIVKSASMIE